MSSKDYLLLKLESLHFIDLIFFFHVTRVSCYFLLKIQKNIEG